ncbi:STAS domain-containing protein [Actinomycetospora straminea]|uniref:MlaB-like STAS domain-containing protein n=1 Tax=Actinomycetospora straminea TaxID=663607 RepID=A0ABP9ECW7_9PSEU|nr:STAS domain-containing protein [Actinomycetospora straminea]MDD7934396.1 STAS domain-containing protein [Actinomycetospora straminea]
MTIDTEAPARTTSSPAVHDVDLDVDVPADLAERRRRAVAEAVAHAEPAATGNRRAAVGIRRYGPGCVALALRGRFDRTGRERLRALAAELERQAGTELVIDLSGLDGCDAGLARVLGRLRIRCLAREARVELHDPPEALAAELGHRP